jgi:MFS family permease
VRVYWTALIGLFFDYYDLYLFIYLDKTLAAYFSLAPSAGQWLQFAGLASVGLGSLLFGYLADRFGRGRLMLVVFGVYVFGVAGLSLAWNYESLLGFRVLASLALGAEWGISHRYMTRHVTQNRRYLFAALLQFSLLGGLLAALMTRYLLPVCGWRWLFAGSIPPVAVLALARWRVLTGEDNVAESRQEPFHCAMARNLPAFLLCLALAGLTIASGTVNVFFVKELPQTPLYTVLFWTAAVPGMLGGTALVRRFGVGRALWFYAAGLGALSLGCWASSSPSRGQAFALGLPLLNGIPFGLMGGFFNEVFDSYPTTLSGAAYNLGRIFAALAPWLVAALGLHSAANYFLFTAILAALVCFTATFIVRWRTMTPSQTSG